MVRVSTYKEYKQYVQGFIDGYIPFIIIKSSGGHGKTYTFEQFKKKGHNIIFLSGHVTPLKFYLTMMENPTAKIILDDVGTTFTNKTMGELLKQATELKPKKWIRYASTTAILKPEEKEFLFSGRIGILTNENPKNNNNHKALITRCIFIDFKPSNDEILNIMKHFPKTEEEKKVYDFIYTYKDVISLNFRDYKKINMVKDANIDWKGYFISEKKINTTEQKIEKAFIDYEQKHINKQELKIQVMNQGLCSKTFYNMYNKRYPNK